MHASLTHSPVSIFSRVTAPGQWPLAQQHRVIIEMYTKLVQREGKVLVQRERKKKKPQNTNVLPESSIED